MENPSTASSSPPAGSIATGAGLRRLPRFLGGPWLMATSIFLFSLWLNTRHNDFPYTYHPDERGKVLQITERTRNFHHPLLLLSATDWAMRLGGVKRTPQSVVVAGRWVSAAFAAGSVTALAMIAWLSYGALAGWAAGVVLALQVDLFKTAHYMKEDPALMFGLALALLAAHLWSRAPTRRALLFFGFACGIAAAGKYLGIVALFFAAPLVLLRSGEDDLKEWKARLKLFAVAFGLTFLLGNTPFPVSEISSPFRSINHEMSGVTGGHRGLSRQAPHAIYFEKLRRSTPPVLICFAAAYAVALLVTARRRDFVEWLNFLFPVAFVAMLSCSPKIADRYLIPVNVTLAFVAVLGIAEISRTIGAPDARLRHALALLALAAGAGWLVFAELPPFREAFAEYATDDHAVLAAWVSANLPREAVIAEDHRVNLSASKSDGVSIDARVPQTVLDSDFAADLGSLDELRMKGVTHVAVCRDSYDRFLEKGVKPGKEEKADYDRRKLFYTQLFAQGKLLREWPSGKIAYLHPGMKLYGLLPADSKPGE
jgi:hypothetical protein